MDTDQIRRAMNKGNQRFLGVFARDKIADLRVPSRRPVGLIVNTDPSWKSGTHWVCMYLDGENRGTYFDSYGRLPPHDDFYSFMTNNGEHWTINNQTLQQRNSSSCGRYCIFYLKHRHGGSSHEKIMSFFGKHSRCNDRLADRHYKTAN